MRIRRHLSFANVVALLALFVALGGGAYAVKSNSVGTKQLKKNAVAKKNLKKNAIVSSKVKNGSLKDKDVKEGTLTGEKLADNTITGSQVDESSLGIPKAWANVSPSGGVISGKGISSADLTKGTAFPGVYCFDGVGGATAQATGGVDSPPTEFATATVLNASSATGAASFDAFGCPPSTSWMVVTQKDGAGSAFDAYFTVAFFD